MPDLHPHVPEEFGGVHLAGVEQPEEVILDDGRNVYGAAALPGEATGELGEGGQAGEQGQGPSEGPLASSNKEKTVHSHLSEGWRSRKDEVESGAGAVVSEGLAGGDGRSDNAPSHEERRDNERGDEHEQGGHTIAER